jgi:hypothetical protein
LRKGRRGTKRQRDEEAKIYNCLIISNCLPFKGILFAFIKEVIASQEISEFTALTDENQLILSILLSSDVPIPFLR